MLTMLCLFCDLPPPPFPRTYPITPALLHTAQLCTPTVACLTPCSAKLAAKMGGAVQAGGKAGRRKPAKISKTATVDDKKLQAVLKQHKVTTIPGIEEVQLFKSDGTLTYFSSPTRAFLGCLLPPPPPLFLHLIYAPAAPTRPVFLLRYKCAVTFLPLTLVSLLYFTHTFLGVWGECSQGQHSGQHLCSIRQRGGAQGHAGGSG